MKTPVPRTSEEVPNSDPQALDDTVCRSDSLLMSRLGSVRQALSNMQRHI